MRPETNGPWRKTLRRESRGLTRGHRRTRRVETEAPRRGSTWLRRHSWMPEAWQIWQQRTRRPLTESWREDTDGFTWAPHSTA